jgi:hypothetical protein
MPLTPVSTKGVPHGDTYVVCLDCGKQFDYDLTKMRIGKPIDHAHDACVVPKPDSLSPAAKMKFAALAAVPVAMVLGAILKGKKPGPALRGDEPRDDDPAAPR